MKQIRLSLLIILFSGLMFILFAPYFPIDETRYLSVAWDMHLHHSFIVPLLNGLPYAHKPPFLFWLINLDWLTFGINEKTLRLIPILFSIFNIVLVHRIAVMLWDDRKTARYASIVLSSTLVYLIWSALIMFDIILTFWILLGMYGIFSAYINNNDKKSWVITGIAIGGGLLTKGPVVFVHILPVSIFPFLWMPRKEISLKWYKGLLLSLCMGIVILLIWLIPAVITGGESYRHAILWKQTVDRVVSSFAHQRPVWWYLPLVPVLLLPWILLKSFRRGLYATLIKSFTHKSVNIRCKAMEESSDRPHGRYSGIKPDKGSRFLITWLLSAFIIHSLISGKQVHYLIPLLPGASLLMAKNIAINGKNRNITNDHYLIGIFYIIIGIGISILPFIKSSDIADIPAMKFAGLASGLIAMGGGIMFLRPKSINRLIQVTALSSAVFIAIALINASLFFARYDMTRISHVLKEKQEAGYQILHYRKYDGQYQFAGRLTKPILVLNSKEAVKEYIKNHDKVVLISYERLKKNINAHDFYFQQLYRGRKIILWNKKGISDFLKL